MDTFLAAYGLPVFGLLYGVAAVLIASHLAHDFDREYGHRPTVGE